MMTFSTEDLFLDVLDRNLQAYNRIAFLYTNIPVKRHHFYLSCLSTSEKKRIRKMKVRLQQLARQRQLNRVYFEIVRTNMDVFEERMNGMHHL